MFKIANRKFLCAILMSALTLTLSTGNVFAAEPTNTDNVLEVSINESSENEIIDIDPNIIVTVTEIDKPSIQPRSWYSSTFSYNGSFVSNNYRYYDGNHIGVEISTSSSSSGNFTLKLRRQGSLGDTVVKTANIPQNGNFKIDFWNVNNPNNYRWGFVQDWGSAADQSGSMTMFSWQ